MGLKRKILDANNVRMIASERDMINARTYLAVILP